MISLVYCNNLILLQFAIWFCPYMGFYFEGVADIFKFWVLCILFKSFDHHRQIYVVIYCALSRCLFVFMFLIDMKWILEKIADFQQVQSHKKVCTMCTVMKTSPWLYVIYDKKYLAFFACMIFSCTSWYCVHVACKLLACEKALLV